MITETLVDEKVILGIVFRNIRLKKKLVAREIADSLGYKATTAVYNYEKGISPIAYDRKNDILCAIDMNYKKFNSIYTSLCKEIETRRFVIKKFKDTRTFIQKEVIHNTKIASEELTRLENIIESCMTDSGIYYF